MTSSFGWLLVKSPLPEFIHLNTSHKLSTAHHQSDALNTPHQTVFLPGEFIDVLAPKQPWPWPDMGLEPRLDALSNINLKSDWAWPAPQEIMAVGHTSRLCNTSIDPILLKCNEHFCHVRSLTSSNVITPESQILPTKSVPSDGRAPYSSKVSIDPDGILTP